MHLYITFISKCEFKEFPVPMLRCGARVKTRPCLTSALGRFLFTTCAHFYDKRALPLGSMPANTLSNILVHTFLLLRSCHRPSTPLICDSRRRTLHTETPLSSAIMDGSCVVIRSTATMNYIPTLIKTNCWHQCKREKYLRWLCIQSITFDLNKRIIILIILP